MRQEGHPGRSRRFVPEIRSRLDTDADFNTAIADTSTFVDNDICIRIKAKPSNLKILLYSCQFIRTSGQVLSVSFNVRCSGDGNAEADATSVSII